MPFLPRIAVIGISTFLLCASAILHQANAEDLPKPQGSATPTNAALPKFERLANGDIRLGAVTLHRQTREISFPAKINLDTGPLDVLIATPVGRLYESLLGCSVNTLHLQTLLYLLDLKNGPRLPDAKGRQGDIVDIELEWRNAEGKLIREPVEKWICHNTTDEPVKRPGWVFVGSSVANGVFRAEAAGNLAIIYSCDDTVLDLPDPGAEQAWTFVVNPEKTKPGKDASVRVILIPRKRQP